MKQTLNKKTTKIFVVGYTLGCILLGYAFIDNLIFKNPVQLGLIGMAVTVVLGTSILVLASVIERAEQVFKEHGLDWEKEVLEREIVKK